MDKANVVTIKELIHTVDSFLIYGRLSVALDALRIGMLMFGLEEIRDRLVNIYNDEASRPWCCHLECRERAVWMIVHGPSPDDNTQACDRHLPDLLTDYNEVCPISNQGDSQCALRSTSVQQPSSSHSV